MLISRNYLNLIIVMLFTNIMLFFNIWDYSGEYKYELVCILLASFIVSVFYLFTAYQKRIIDYYHPLHLITFLYFMLFIIGPTWFVIGNRADCYGTNVMGGCVKGTVIFVLGYIVFCLAYLNTAAENVEKINASGLFLTERTIIQLSFIIWLVGCISATLYLLSIGKTFSYILTLGNQGVLVEASDGATRFLISFGYMMAFPCIMLFSFCRRKHLLFPILYITLALYYTMGYRFIMLIVIVGCCIMHFRSKSKILSTVGLVAFIASILVLIGIVGFMRQGVRTGNITDLSGFDFDDIIYALESNFDIYKPYYGLVQTYPQKYDHTMGGSMIVDTLAMWIPRAIWPGKPLATEQTMVVALMNSVNSYAITGAAMAWPNIAEYYMEFGIVGVIVFMAILGRVASKAINWYTSNNTFDVVKYAVLMPAFLQLIIRGYTPSNVTMLAFLFIIPICIYRIVEQYVIARNKGFITEDQK